MTEHNMDRFAAMTEKVGKLLAKAESTDSDHERDALTAQAERLMIKYGIEEAMAREAAGSNVRPEDIIETMLKFNPTYGKAIMRMLTQAVSALGLQAYRRGGTLFYIVGHESDVKSASILCQSIHLQATSAMWKWWKNEGKEQYAWENEYFQEKARMAFYEEFGYAVGARLRAERKQESDEVVGSALVLRNREQEVRDHMESMQIRKSRAQSYGANLAGYSAGMKANLGGTGVTGGHTQIGG